VGQGEKDREQARREDLERYRRVGIKAWAIIGCVAVFVIAIRALGLVWPAVELLLVGVIMGFICSPITNALNDRGLGRGFSAFVALLAVLAIITGVLVLLGQPFVDELVQLLRKVPSYVSQIQVAINEFWATHGTTQTQDVEQLMDQVWETLSTMGTSMASDTATKLSTGVVQYVRDMASHFVTFFLGLVVAFWFAKDYPVMAREFALIAGPDHEDDVSMLLAVMSRSMGGYMRGTVITSVAAGVLAFVGYTAIGHPFAGLMAIFMGVFHIVPVIGAILASIFAIVLALFVSPMLALLTLIVTLAVSGIAGNIVQPFVMQSSVKVHPVLSLLGIVVGQVLGGVLGMALAVPLTAAIRSVFVYYFERRTGTQLVSYDGAFFKSTPFRDAEGNIQPSYDALDDDKFFESTKLVSPREEEPPVEPVERPEGAPRTIVDIIREHGDDVVDAEVEPLDDDADADDDAVAGVAAATDDTADGETR